MRTFALSCLLLLLASPAFASGGPDAYGYSWTSTSYDWEAPSASASTASLSSGTQSVSLPFGFRFYGTTHTSVRLRSDGALSFRSTSIPSVPYCVPDSASTAPDILAYHAQLTGGTVRYEAIDNGTRFVVTWVDISHQAGGGTISFQVHLLNDNSIEFHYLDTDHGDPALDDGAVAASGVQAATAGNVGFGWALSSSCSDATLDSGDAIRFEACEDLDGDGLTTCDGDCNDADYYIPRGYEIGCNGVDDDCIPGTPDLTDDDGDGFTACGDEDCNDSAFNTNPDAPEQYCDGDDNDCDPTTTDDVDLDGDGRFRCQTDCDDDDPAIYTGHAEILCNGQDDDCEPTTDDDSDNDADGETDCDGDCDDDDPTVSSLLSEATCDGADNDCDPATLDGPDLDGDGVPGCVDDCDDTDPLVFPGAPERCNGVDDNCSGLTAPTTWTAPLAVNDLSGTNVFRGLRLQVVEDVSLRTIEARLTGAATRTLSFAVYGSDTGDGTFVLEAEGEVVHTGDGSATWVMSPDQDHALLAGRTYVVGVGWSGGFAIRHVPAAVLPLATPFGELLGGVTIEDFDGLMPGELFEHDVRTFGIRLTLGGEDDPDGDGTLSCDDCSPADASVYPGAPELCDGFDSDCDGSLAADEEDVDGDGLTPCQGDCDDADDATFDGAPELCNGLDDDCDGGVPADETADSDGDGSVTCTDCDDADATRFPTATDVCNAVDEDCDGLLQGTIETLVSSTSDAVEYAQGTFGFTLTPRASRRLVEFRVRMRAVEPGTLVIGQYDNTTSATRWFADQVVEVQVAAEAGFQWVSSGPLDIALSVDDQVRLGFHYDAEFELAQAGLGHPHALSWPAEVVESRYNTTETDPYAQMWTSSSNTNLWGVELVFEDDVDLDADGFLSCEDCADDDPLTYPGVTEACNGRDDDCDGVVPADEVNLDGDPYWLCEDDCDDSDGSIFPGADEVCDGIDNDCDGATEADEVDNDGDGVRLCDDCDDADPAANLFVEELCDGVDSNCDGYLTLVHDPGPRTTLHTTSSRMRANIYFATRDAVVDGLEAYASTTDYDYWSFTIYEADSVDGPWDTQLVRLFLPQPDSPAHWIDSGALNQPIEAGKYYSFGWNTPYSGYDNYLMGRIDDAPLPLSAGFGELVGSHDSQLTGNWYPDEYTLDPNTAWQLRVRWGSEVDGDGDGAPACGDCDDTDPSFAPDGTPELCDGYDSNCDGVLPDDEADLDGDGSLICLGDCDDMDPAVNPSAAEVCDAVDTDCDGVLGADDEVDTDGDGQADCVDCDAADPLAWTDAPEICDGVDSDCTPDTDMPSEFGYPEYRWSSASVPGAAGFYGVKWQPAVPITLWQTHLYFARFENSVGDAVAANVTWQLWSGPAEDGPWTLVDEQAEYIANYSPSPSGESSPFVQKLLQPGTWYVAGAHLPRSTNAMTLGRRDRPAVEPMGILAGTVVLPGADVPSGSPTFATQTGDPLRVWFDILNEGIDIDEDGSDRCADCDSGDAARFPGNPEICDGVDNDCDGLLAVDEATDADGDGQAVCEGDCDDADPDTFLAATELCDAVDNDCDGGDASGELVDQDGDGWTCDDCDDEDAAVHPNTAELCNGVDDDCDLMEVDGWFSDSTPQGSNDLGEYWNTFAWGFQPDEQTVLRALGAHLSSPVGTDVRFAIWEQSNSSGPTQYTRIVEETSVASGGWQDLLHVFEEDVVLDTSLSYLFGVSLTHVDARMRAYSGSQALAPPSGNWIGRYQDDLFLTTWTVYNHGGNSSALDFIFAGEWDPDGDGWPLCANDCDNAESTVYPGAPELCDALDNDCDGDIEFPNELDDADADGAPVCDDCDDLLPTVSPDAIEVCDGVDNDCDGVLGADETDGDGDGSTVCGGDCDDGDASVFPGAAEVCNGADDDCDGVVPADEADGDGDGVSACDGDCDDGDAAVLPSANEICDGIDGDCDGVLPADEADDDGDGQRVCSGDCDDGDGSVYLGATESCNGVDDDCDGSVPSDESDDDGDGAPGCADCDDADPLRFDDAPELCDGIDNDCDGAVPSDESDSDGDGVSGCAGDCDDGQMLVFPGAPELCDGLDNDCDAGTDEDADVDGDGFGACSDCDESDEDINPDAAEVCNGVDDDCESDTDELVDGDGDGLAVCDDDCDDDNAAVFPGQPEVCNGIDDDCDEATGESDDHDGDGYTPCQGDCDDQRPNAWPGATEQCNGLDDNCDGLIIPLEMDADGDGFIPCDDDCDDSDASNNPDATEDCFDGEDNDCDGQADSGDSDCAGDDDDATGDDDDDATGDDDDATGDDDDDATEDDDDAVDDDDDDAMDDDDADDDDDDDDATDEGCACSTGDGSGSLLLLALVALRRRRPQPHNRGRSVRRASTHSSRSGIGGSERGRSVRRASCA